MSQNNFVESTIPLRAIKSAVALQHSHANKELLDSLTTGGSAIQFLAADGQYHDLPETFSAEAFLLKYNQSGGNVTAYKDDNGDLYLKATNTFASALGGKVIGSIELERASDKQLNVSIAEVDVNSGAISENEIKYITASNGIKLNFTNGVVSFELVQAEAPFTNLMAKQTTVAQGIVGMFDATGQVVGGGILLSDLATAVALSQHASDENLHVTAELQAVWSAKQNALNGDQVAAVNSGITAVKVGQYDGYATGKLNVGGHDVGKNVVTDASGNITTEDKFDPSTKINTVPTAVQDRVANFTSNGMLKDSGVTLGTFSNMTVRDYIDTAISSSISGSSYQGTFTYFGSREQVESLTDAKAGDTAIVYVGSISNLGGLLKGDFNGTEWTFSNVEPAPTSGAWMEVDNLLTNDPIVPGRVIVKMDGVHDPSLDVRPQTSTMLDNTTITLNSAGAVSLMMRTLSSGKTVLNTVTADNIAYEFTEDGGTDTTRTIKEVIDANAAAAEPKFTKNTAFNKNFDTSSQSETSTKVIGDKDTRLTDARPASDVYAWAKAPERPTYTYEDVGALAANGTAVAASKFATARTIRVALDSTQESSFDGTQNITPGVWGTLPVSHGGTGVTNLTSGYAIIGNGTDAVTFREIVSTITSGSTALFTSGGAYTLANSKQNKITVSSSTPAGVSGDLWFQTGSGNTFTIRNYTGTSWGTLYPEVDPTWKAAVDAAVANAGNPYVCTVNSDGSEVLTNVPSWVWTGSAGNYSVTIPYSSHSKGKIVVGSATHYLPRVHIFNKVPNGGYQMNDSPFVSFTNGAVTLYANTTDALVVMIY